MDVETSFDLEKDKCLKILLMFFQPQELREKKLKEWEIKQTTRTLHVWTFLKKINSIENLKSTISRTILFQYGFLLKS